MAKTNYLRTGLTGGGATNLDGIDGAALLDDDRAYVSVANVLYLYTLDDDAGGVEASPNKIIPDSNPGTKAWILQAINCGSGTIAVDHIAESTAGHGVVIDSVTLKDGKVNDLTPTALAVGFTIAGGTTSKTLTVTGDATISGTPVSPTYATAAEITTGTEAAKAIAPDHLAEALFATIGDIPYASANLTPNKLAAGAANLKLFMNAAGTAPEWASGIKLGTLTRAMTAASGDVSYTAVGFKPSLILLFGGCSGTTIGLFFGALQDLTGAQGINNYASAGTGVIYYDGSRFWLMESGSLYQSAILKSFDVDGFTLTWTLNGTPATQTAQLSYIAFR